MQKLDFNQAINSLIQELRSETIVQFVDEIPLSSHLNIQDLTPLIIESKSNYDKIPENTPEFEISKALNGQTIYDQVFIGQLINQTMSVSLADKRKVNLFLDSKLLQFYNYHFLLTQISRIANNVLFNEEALQQVSSDDMVVFRIIANEENLDLNTFGKILKLLRELIEIIQKILEPDNTAVAKVILLDSGSDSNIGISSTVKVATSLFQIFKEIWDWVLNRKFYKNKLRNDSILDNLTVFNAIKESEDKGAIDADTAKLYRETVLRRTEDLLELKTIPKKLVKNGMEVSNLKILSEYTETRLIEDKTEK